MNVLNSLLSYVLLYKYAAIAVVVYAGAAILPLPANAMLLAVGAFASQGYFSFWAALSVAVTANTLGDLTGYWIARRFGERVTRALRLHRFRFYGQLQDELRVDAAVTVFLTRFAGSLSSIANLLAGLVGVPFRTFFTMDVFGNIIEPLGALALGFAVGEYWSDFSELLDLAAAVVALSVIIFVLARIQRRIARRFS